MVPSIRARVLLALMDVDLALAVAVIWFVLL